MKKTVQWMLCILIIINMLPVTAHADMGPKPSTRIFFENMGDALCYATLLSETDSTGPYSVWDGKEEHIDIPQDIPEDVWYAFAEYKDADGYFFLDRAIWKVNESKTLFWTYYPPESFKLLLYYPDTGKLSVSGICERYAFDSYFTVDMSNGVPDKISKSYHWQPEMLSLAARILITIAVELLIALLFGFRSKKELLFLAAVNVATQILLNILLNLINFKSGPLAFVGAYIVLELAVFAVEAVLYTVFLRKLSQEARPAWKYIIYALLANALSFGAGLYIARVIPGIF